jgi:hypothetical protein
MQLVLRPHCTRAAASVLKMGNMPDVNNEPGCFSYKQEKARTSNHQGYVTIGETSPSGKRRHQGNAIVEDPRSAACILPAMCVSI